MNYHLEVMEFDESKVLTEIEKITDLLMKTNPESGMYQQMQSMLRALQERQDELQFLSRTKIEDKIIEIGTVEEHIHMPDYSKKELLDVVVTQYADLDPTQGENNGRNNND